MSETCHSVLVRVALMLLLLRGCDPESPQTLRLMMGFTAVAFLGTLIYDLVQAAKREAKGSGE